ncbi:retinoic acid receptor responder protein 2-like [Mantella aurantiaca]
MTLYTITWGLISALLVLSTQGEVPAQEMSNLQSKALRLVMENLHKKNNIRNVFRLTSILQESEEELDDGLFVSLEIEVKQTKCHKDQLMNPNCNITRDGKSYSCVGCFKFDFRGQKVRSKFIHCIPPNRSTQEKNINMRRENCKNLKKPKHQPSVYNVGSVTFLRYRSPLENDKA